MCRRARPSRAGVTAKPLQLPCITSCAGEPGLLELVLQSNHCSYLASHHVQASPAFWSWWYSQTIAVTLHHIMCRRARLSGAGGTAKPLQLPCITSCAGEPGLLELVVQPNHCSYLASHHVQASPAFWSWWYSQTIAVTLHHIMCRRARPSRAGGTAKPLQLPCITSYAGEPDLLELVVQPNHCSYLASHHVQASPALWSWRYSQTIAVTFDGQLTKVARTLQSGLYPLFHRLVGAKQLLSWLGWC